MKEKIQYLYNWILIILGDAITALGVSWFLTPLNVTPGGLTGLATIIAYLIKIPAGVTLLMLNLPLVILGVKKLGTGMMIRTVVSSIAYSVFIDLFDNIRPFLNLDITIGTVSGGVVVGVGMGIILANGATSGGTDIGAKLLRIKYPYASTGSLVLILDAIIVGISALVYKSVELSLYAVLGIFVTTTVFDRILSGGEGGKLAFIVTDSPTAVKSALYEVLRRGVSEISIKGGYSNEGKTLLICALRRQQIGKFNNALKEYRDNCFVVLCDAGQIMGRGFNETPVP